ncbi:MAG: hypothetical protein IPO38_13550 [Rhodocyclaceae bacterium]|nr:hypothetical protein [Rhodocyclaceae bacterium]MBP6109721.1 hypothetical protein [Rhodocyclaceae bacterium]
MNTFGNALFSVIVLPVSNEQIIGASILPYRYVSGSKSQQAEIVGADLASTAHSGRKISPVPVVIPIVAV